MQNNRTSSLKFLFASFLLSLVLSILVHVPLFGELAFTDLTNVALLSALIYAPCLGIMTFLLGYYFGTSLKRGGTFWTVVLLSHIYIAYFYGFIIDPVAGNLNLVRGIVAGFLVFGFLVFYTKSLPREKE